MDKNNNEPISDIILTNLDDDVKLLFVSGEYTEINGGSLPKLSIDFIDVKSNFFIQKYKEVDIQLRIREEEWITHGTIDSITHNINNAITVFITLAPMDFYFKSKVNKFKNINDVVTQLYFNDINNSMGGLNLLPTNDIEINQAGVTDYKILNTSLRSMIPSGIFSYNMNSLKLTDLSYDNFIDINDKKSLYVVDNLSQKEEFNYKSVKETPNLFLSMKDGNSTDRLNTMEFLGKKIQFNSIYKTLVENIIKNSISLKNRKIILRVTSQYSLGIETGDLISIGVPETDLSKYIVLSRLIVVGSSPKFNYQLLSLE